MLFNFQSLHAPMVNIIWHLPRWERTHILGSVFTKISKQVTFTPVPVWFGHRFDPVCRVSHLILNWPRLAVMDQIWRRMNLLNHILVLHVHPVHKKAMVCQFLIILTRCRRAEFLTCSGEMQLCPNSHRPRAAILHRWSYPLITDLRSACQHYHSVNIVEACARKVPHHTCKCCQLKEIIIQTEWHLCTRPTFT